MAVNFEIKGMLAKCLAMEDIIIEHKQVETASFNVQTRVLTLPLWEKASDNIYTMLVLHEISHSLWTPNIDWEKEYKIPQQFVNVVEDARVEKLCKRKYPGSPKSFFNGYKELNQEDFFQLEDEDISSFNLADRANLYFKIGNFICLDFTPEEKEIIDLIGAAETFADVLIASEELYKYCKNNQNQQKLPELNTHSQSGATSGSSEIVEVPEDNQSEENDNFSMQKENDTETPGNAKGDQIQMSSPSNEQNDPEIRTAKSFDEKIRDLVNPNAQESIYVEIPQVNLDTVIGKNQEVHSMIDNHFSVQQEKYNESHTNPVDIFESVDKQYNEFKLSAQKEVNYLVKEFECRKAADQYARASTARTGVLDTARLHSYKFSEDLFKKVTVLPDGKNHGLIFILDWSGSMQHVLLDTCKQLFNLIWFCKKVSIPFDVYAFTNEWRRGEYDYDTGRYLAADRTPHYEKKDGLLSIDETFSLMNIITSKVSGKNLEHQLLNIWRIAFSFERNYQCSYTYPSRLSLSGTPLNEALVCLHQILPQFQQENKLQKVQCIVLTDGEANMIPYHVEVKRKWESQPYIGIRGVSPDKTFLRDRKMGTTYKFEYEYHKCTDILLRNLKDKFPSVNFIGIRVLGGRDASRFIQLYHSWNEKYYEVMQNDWKKMKSFIIKNSGYDAYFGLSASVLSQENEFEVKEDATKAQIKSAFVKSLKTKKLNKKVLGEFISLVA